VWIIAGMGGLGSTAFTLAHWMFACKYWALSFIVQATTEGISYTKKIKCLSILNIVVIINSVIWPIVISALFVYSSLQNVLDKSFETAFFCA
jgi:hypothetical protein